MPNDFEFCCHETEIDTCDRCAKTKCYYDYVVHEPIEDEELRTVGCQGVRFLVPSSECDRLTTELDQFMLRMRKEDRGVIKYQSIKSRVEGFKKKYLLGIEHSN